MLSVFSNATNVENIQIILNTMSTICFELSNDSITPCKRKKLIKIFEEHLNRLIEENNIFKDLTYDLRNAENSITTYKKIIDIKCNVL